MAWYKKFLIFLGVLILIGFGAGYWFMAKYNAIVKQVVITNLNKSLASEVDVKSIDFSVYSSFPYASLDFNEVLIRENKVVIGTPDTLLYAKTVKLNFNVIDIYNGNYNIKRIVVEKGLSKIKLDENGEGNFNILKPSKDSTSENFSLALEEVLLQEVTIKYHDDFNSIFCDGNVNNLSAKGNFSQSVFDMNLKGTIENLSYTDEQIGNLKLVSLNPNFGLTINTEENTYYFKPSDAIVNDLHALSFTGKILENGYEFKIDGHKLNPISFTSIFNTDWATELANYEIDGKVDLTFNLSKNLNSKTNYNLFFKWQNGQFQFDDEGALVSGIFAKGFYKPSWNGEFEKGNITVDSLFLPVKEGNIAGNLLIENIKTPKFTANLKGALNFNGPPSFLNADSTIALFGDYTFEGKLVLPLWRWTFKTEDLSKLQFQGFLATGQNIKIPIENGVDIIIENVETALSSQKAIIQNLSFARGNSSLTYTGELINYWKYLFVEDQKLYVKGGINAENLIFDDISFTSNSNSSNSSFFPQNIAASVSANILHFEYGTFSADSATGSFLISPSLIQANNMSLKTMEGKLFTNLTLKPSDKETMFFQAVGKTNHINVSALFKSFKNFEQDFIRDDHLEGYATSKFNAKGEIDYQFQPNYKTLEAIVDIEIKNGKLKGFEPLAEINDYFKEQPVLKRLVNTAEFGKRINSIAFSDLKNTLQLKNSVVSIPNISVASSVMAINVEGSHSFSNDIDYSLSFDLRDLMMKDQVSATEFGEIEDDGLGGKIIYLKISGNVDDFEITWDKKKKREAQKNEFQKEKEAIKDILKDEFNKTPENHEIENKAFEIEWEEFENTEDTLMLESPKDTTNNKKKKNSFLKKILENPEEKEKKPQVIFDDDF